VTNTSTQPISVNLSTRALTQQVASQSGTFCMQPGTPSVSCPANTGTMTIGSGATDVYQEVTFTVPSTTQPSRLNFSSDFQNYQGETSQMHVALLEPDGTYAGYSNTQGAANFDNILVADPPAGTWTAVFFTVQNNGTTDFGASGPIQWNANVSQFASAGSISPSSLSLAAGATGTASLGVKSPGSAGDTSQSVVVSSSGQVLTTIPVTVRTTVATTTSGGQFSGVLTGGNGRAGAQAQANYYTFSVPKGAQNIHAEIHLANDPRDLLTGYLISPTGQNLGYSSNVTLDGTLANAVSTRSVDLYHAQPAPGQWTIALQWNNPVSGLELQEPFTGTISFAKLPITGNLPAGPLLTKGKTYAYKVTIHNNGKAPEAYFVDPRLHTTVKLTLPNQNPPSFGGVNAHSMTLPLPAPTQSSPLPFPYYLVPTESSQISESLTGSAPVNFDSSYFPGDPDLEGTQSGNSAHLTFNNAEVTPGIWTLIPSEIGPYNTTTGAPLVTASATFKAVTKAFDPAVSSATGDLWKSVEGLAGQPRYVYIPAGRSATITVHIKVTGAHRSRHSGILYVDDLSIAGFIVGFGLPNADEVIALPYHYITR
jgi:hypothetical protein